MKTLGVYIHVPFCVQKCAYCDFLSSPATRQAQIEYLRALKREIESESVKYKEFEVDTVFFGGGTPSILESNDIIEVMQVLRKFYNISENAEVSMEVNPATANLEKMIGLRNAGVNRLSIGLQSTNDEELKLPPRTQKDNVVVHISRVEISKSEVFSETEIKTTPQNNQSCPPLAKTY